MLEKIQKIAVPLAVIALGLLGYYLWEELREKTMPEKLARIIHLEDQRLPTDQFEGYLNDDSTQVRSRAALALGRVGEVESGPLLIDMIYDPSVAVARTAAFAIGLTGLDQFAGPLVEIANDLPASVTAAAIISAGRLADTSMTEVAEGLLEYLEHPAPEVREAACLAVFYAGVPEAVAELIPFIEKETDRTVQIAALYALSRLGIDAATPQYIRFQSDADPEVRMLAVRGLGRSSSTGAVRLLAVSLNDADDRVVAAAVGGLRTLGTELAAEYLANKLETETDEKLIVAELSALGAMESNLGATVAEMHLRAALSDNLVIASLGYLASIKGEGVVSLVDSLLSDTLRPEVRAACAEAYGQVRRSSVIPRLAVLFRDEDPLVRSAAFQTLAEVDSANLDFYISQALEDKDLMPVVLALDLIGQEVALEYLPQIQLMQSHSYDFDVDVRRSLIDVVDRFIDSLGPDSTFAELVITALFDPEYVVRRQAAEIYQTAFERDRSSLVPPAGTRLTEARIARALENYTTPPLAIMYTSKGVIEFALDFEAAPLTVLNFTEQAHEGFYDGLRFHRVVPNFVVQGGDPRGDGWGGPDYLMRCEYSDRHYRRGTVGIATSGKDTGGSQFFFTLSPQPHLDGRYTIFGQVTSGMEVVDQLVVGDEIEKIDIMENDQ